MTKRSVSLALAAVAAGALAGPPVIATAKNVAQSVIVTNTTENPVVTKSTGTTDVQGTVGLADGTSVALADGSIVGLADGSQVSLADNTVRLADGSAVELADGSTVQLAAGSLVGLADGSKVKLDGPVDLADGATVALADNTAVTIGNTDADPVPVRIVGGGGGGGSAEPARQVFSFRSDVLIAENLTRAYGQSYTVPDGKTLVITHASGHATEKILRIELERRTCFDSGQGMYQYGVLSGSADNERVWHMPGEWGARGGCELVPSATHTPGQGPDRASFHYYGYLIDE